LRKKRNATKRNHGHSVRLRTEWDGKRKWREGGEGQCKEHYVMHQWGGMMFVEHCNKKGEEYGGKSFREGEPICRQDGKVQRRAF